MFITEIYCDYKNCSLVKVYNNPFVTGKEEFHECFVIEKGLETTTLGR